MRPTGCIISIHFTVTAGGQRAVEVMVQKADLALVGIEVHLRAGQSGISGKAHSVEKGTL